MNELKRNTPTGVGKTPDHAVRLSSRWKHPHGRGEDQFTAWKKLEAVETPPRAWGRLGTACRQSVKERNTPTGVGKTLSRRAAWAVRRKHPHGRGEDSPFSSQA